MNGRKCAYSKKRQQSNHEASLLCGTFCIKMIDVTVPEQDWIDNVQVTNTDDRLFLGGFTQVEPIYATGLTTSPLN